MHTRLASLLCCGIAIVPGSPAAAANTVEAAVYTIYEEQDTADGGTAVGTVAVCTGEASAGATDVTVTCEVYDSSGDPGNQLRHSRNTPGPTCACLVSAYDLRAPVTWCATAVATFMDSSTASHRACKHLGAPPPPENPPAPRTGVVHSYLQCLNPAGIHVNDPVLPAGPAPVLPA